MKTGIAFSTMTGHSKKIAQAVGKSSGFEVIPLKNQPQPSGYDLLFLVAGIYGGQCSPQLLESVLAWSPQTVKKVVLMSSSASGVKQTALREALIQVGIEVDEKEFSCDGSFLFTKFRHPNKTDLQAASDFAQQILKGMK